MFRFNIRDLLWLTLLAAFAVAWYIDRHRLAEESQAFNERQAVLTQQLEETKQLVQTVRLVHALEQKWKADKEFEDRMQAEALDDSTRRYLRAVRDPKNGFHYPVLLKDEPNP